MRQKKIPYRPDSFQLGGRVAAAWVFQRGMIVGAMVVVLLLAVLVTGIVMRSKVRAEDRWQGRRPRGLLGSDDCVVCGHDSSARRPSERPGPYAGCFFANASLCFPGSGPPPFAFNGASYEVSDTLRHGAGYWVKRDRSTSADYVHGRPLVADTFNLVKGWNLIGSSSSPIAISQMQSDPPGLAVSQLFGYSNRYSVETVLEPGRGYWLKASGSGRIFCIRPSGQSGG